MRLYIPIMRYVGGEDYEVVDREVLAHQAPTKALRRYINSGNDAEDAMIERMNARNTATFLRNRARSERNARREERYLMLVLQRRQA